MSDVNGCGSTETAAGPTTSSFCGVHCQRPCGSKMLNWLYHINHGDEHVERNCVEKNQKKLLAMYQALSKSFAMSVAPNNSSILIHFPSSPTCPCLFHKDLGKLHGRQHVITKGYQKCDGE